MSFSFGLNLSWQEVIDRERDQGEWFTALQEQLETDQWVMSVGEIPTWDQLLTARMFAWKMGQCRIGTSY